MRILEALFKPAEVESEPSSPNKLSMYLLYSERHPIRLDVMSALKLNRRKVADEKRGFKWALVFDGIPNSDREIEDTMEKVDSLLGNYGTESIRGNTPGQEAVLLYSNSGDMYNTTVCYDVTRRKWFVGDVGQWVENNERRLNLQ